MIKNKELKKKIIDMSYKGHLTHIGSCIDAVDVIKEIYDEKKYEDKFILSNGHAALALYTVLEAVGKCDIAETMLEVSGVHPTRVIDAGINPFVDCTTGSLGHGLPIAVGMAIADPTRVTYVLISDGECAEGSVWEALRLATDLQVINLKVYVIMNGYGAYSNIDTKRLEKRLKAFYPKIYVRHNDLSEIPHLKDMGQLAHYRALDEVEYKEIMKALK